VRLRRQLDKVVKTRTLHRAARAKVPYPVVALVGYTNAGKSTLFNRLTGAEVLVKDMLFATLDPTMRSVKLPGGGPDIILSDTVGFISDLPTELVAAFRATLEEVLGAHLIVHVRDISHPDTAAQARDVHDILGALGVKDTTPMIEVWNKIDRLDPAAHDALLASVVRQDDTCAISAITGEGLDALLEAVTTKLEATRHETQLSLTFAEGRKRAWLHEQEVVEAEVQTDTGFDLTLNWTARQEKRFRDL
jgi:GTPase